MLERGIYALLDRPGGYGNLVALAHTQVGDLLLAGDTRNGQSRGMLASLQT